MCMFVPLNDPVAGFHSVQNVPNGVQGVAMARSRCREWQWHARAAGSGSDTLARQGVAMARSRGRERQ
ncbi:hypothetical protein FKM82_027563 [Ascaphus truei]